MNIFEILAGDSSNSNSFLLTMSQSQRNWSKFKQIIQEFLQDPQESTMYRGHQCWVEIMKTSPEIGFMASQYYISELENYLRNTLRLRIRQSTTILQKIDLIEATIFPNLKFSRIFSNDLINTKIIEETKEIMTEFSVLSTFTHSLKNAYALHCKQLLHRELIDLDEQTKEYIHNNFEDADVSVTAERIKDIMRKFHIIGVLDWCMQPVVEYMNTDLEGFIQFYVNIEECKEFHKQCLNYGRTFQKSFLKSITSDSMESEFMKYISTIDNNVYFLCAKHCSDSILDLILNYPDTLPVILSLHQCIDKSGLIIEISEKLVKGVEKRLLIPGILTKTVLEQYISILKVLQIWDPHGFIFDRVTLPIKGYLLKRNDTLRCIISFLTEDVENYSKLTKEVVKIPSKEYIEEVDSDEDENAAERWEIFNIKESKTKVRIKYQENDLVTMLVNLYGSQEAFINEYQSMLGEKLMSARDYNIEEEVRNIELLKLRFGEGALQTCNIIVKDVKDSRKNDREIHSLPSKVKNSSLSLQQVNCLAVSKGYWPINYEAANTYIPSQFKDIFEEYSSFYSHKKVMRKIFFHYNLGHVNLTLTFDNGSFDFKCMPVHAMLINSFDDSKIKNKSLGVSSEELSTDLNLPQNLIKQKMSFWVHKGVIKETRGQNKQSLGPSLRRINSFEDGEVVHYKPVNEYHQVANDDMEDDIDDLITKESTSMESHLKHIIEGLIISILNINGPKSPEKIHLLLKTIYKTDLDYTYGESQTIEILKKMYQKKKIDFNGETYSTKSEV